MVVSYGRDQGGRGKGNRRTLRTPVSVDREYEDAFRRDVRQVGGDPEDLSTTVSDLPA